MRRVLLIDNYDSFTWNLVHTLLRDGVDVKVARNDRLDVAGAEAGAPTHLVVSPGPGRPEEAGVSLAALAAFHGRIPVLGVCLGHQALGLLFGARVVRVPPVHGRASAITHDGKGVFVGQPAPMEVGRYHSLAVDPATLPPELLPAAWTGDGVLMAVQHRDAPTVGVQFHPESVLTPTGQALMDRVLDLGGSGSRAGRGALAGDERGE